MYVPPVENLRRSRHAVRAQSMFFSSRETRDTGHRNKSERCRQTVYLRLAIHVA